MSPPETCLSRRLAADGRSTPVPSRAPEDWPSPCDFRDLIERPYFISRGMAGREGSKYSEGESGIRGPASLPYG